MGNPGKYYWVGIVALTQVPPDFDREVQPPLTLCLLCVFSCAESQIVQLDPLGTGYLRYFPRLVSQNKFSLFWEKQTRRYRGWLGLVPVLIEAPDFLFLPCNRLFSFVVIHEQHHWSIPEELTKLIQTKFVKLISKFANWAFELGAFLTLSLLCVFARFLEVLISCESHDPLFTYSFFWKLDYTIQLPCILHIYSLHNVCVNKTGQIAVVYHYCDLSRFFWLRRYYRHLHKFKSCPSEGNLISS